MAATDPDPVQTIFTMTIARLDERVGKSEVELNNTSLQH